MFVDLIVIIQFAGLPRNQSVWRVRRERRKPHHSKSVSSSLVSVEGEGSGLSENVYVYHLAWLVCQLSYNGGAGNCLHIINMVNVNHYNYADTAAVPGQLHSFYHADLLRSKPTQYHVDLQISIKNIKKSSSPVDNYFKVQMFRGARQFVKYIYYILVNSRAYLQLDCSQCFLALLTVKYI